MTWLDRLLGRSPGPDATVLMVDQVTSVLRPAGSEQPIGRLLRSVLYQGTDLVLLFDGYQMTIQSPGPVTTVAERDIHLTGPTPAGPTRT